MSMDTKDNRYAGLSSFVGPNPFHNVSGPDLFMTVDFSAAELQARRQQMAAKIGDDASLLVLGAPPVTGHIPRQDAQFYYLSGLETSHSFLLIRGCDAHTTVFMPSRDTLAGDPANRLGFEDETLICDRLGVDAVRATDQLTVALSSVSKLFTPFAEMEGGGVTRFEANGCARKRAEEPWDQAEPRLERLLRQLKARFPAMEVEDAMPFIAEMRTIKSPAEINLLREAARMSAAVMIESMKATRPGVNESHLQAIAEYIYRDQGHCGLGYNVIAASGERTMDGHYCMNNTTLQSGDVVLMDCGPDLRHYTSDIARVWPVSGTFSEWHRKVYGMISEYHKALLSFIRPGVTADEIYEQAAAKMLKQSKGPNSPYGDMSGLITQMIERGVGYLNHAVGLSVHDSVGNWRKEPLREGFVCVLDPMVWCHDEKQYIRVEDTLVITADGCERLTGDAPFSIDEIEAVMTKPGNFCTSTDAGNED